MSFLTSMPAKELQRYHAVVTSGVAVRTHFGLLSWLQGDMQRYLPHAVMIAAWGDFSNGGLRHDIVSPLAGVRSQTSDPDRINPLLTDLFRRWDEFGRKPFALNAGSSGFLLSDDRLRSEVGQALQQMRAAMVHGISDERANHDCLYVLFTSKARYDHRRRSAMSAVLPYIDSALRQITHLPHQMGPTNGEGAATHRNGLRFIRSSPLPNYNLSDRESEIMSWVAMGKTNPEIAQILQISAFTVKNHMQRLFQKLNVANRAQAVSKLSLRVRHVQD